ncbi:hypothetical protein NVP1101O_026 [Vibrio phage 1.101.O._10N.261.45.C6]|nr:hypothetical protein NVP1101O_026 [Vibrio phage 1.101.O._10N.261.45.C6]
MTELTEATVSQVLSKPTPYFGWWQIWVEVKRKDTGEVFKTTLRNELLSEVEKIGVGFSVIVVGKKEKIK